MKRSLDSSLLNPVEQEYLFTTESGENAEMTKKERMTLCVPCGLSGREVRTGYFCSTLLLKRLKEVR